MAQPAVDSSELSDQEIVFRRVLPGQNAYCRDADGRLRVSQTAFNDRTLEPSVDRELLLRECGGPKFTQRSEENSVLRLRVADIRAERLPKKTQRGEVEREYVIDVLSRPEPENAAHCVVKLHPHDFTKSFFRKLLERLALIAEWEIEPRDL